MISKIRKRDGSIVKFEKEKIRIALQKAFSAVNAPDQSSRICEDVASYLEKKYKEKIPSIEDVQDTVEDTLITRSLKNVAKAYILYRAQHTELRNIKHFFGVKDDLKLTMNAVTILHKRYLRRNENGEIKETPRQLFDRVAKHIASAEKHEERKKWELEFFRVMKDLDFLPNTPCLVNAGTPLNQLCACFVLPINDSIEEIFDAMKHSAMIFKTGGGVGYSFSSIREKGSIVQSTGRIASGPISFMHAFDTCAETVKSGGVRRGAMMGVLRIDHPDIFEFITEKAKGSLTNFNVSVGVDDVFMRAVIFNKSFFLRDHNGRKVKKVNARELFDLVCTYAWETGDPGMLFLDTINKKHPLKKLGRIEATNPCGELPLLPNEACCLGSINLLHMIHNGKVDWPKISRTVRIGTRFLDNILTMTSFPTEDIKKMVMKNRKIGLGVMGWADMLIELGIKYDSEEALDLARHLSHFIYRIADEESQHLARERGAFPMFKYSSLKKKRRNATLLTVAPTGSISIVAGCSSGIEPLFGISYVRSAASVGVQFFEVNKRFEEFARYRGFYSRDLLRKISQTGSLKNIKEIPKDIRDIFVTALDVSVEWHVKMQAAFQSAVDNAVSKTINLPEDATIGDVKRAYMLAWKEGCKGITIYRYGSKTSQVLSFNQDKDQMIIDLEYSQCSSGQCYY